MMAPTKIAAHVFAGSAGTPRLDAVTLVSFSRRSYKPLHGPDGEWFVTLRYIGQRSLDDLISLARQTPSHCGRSLANTIGIH